MWTEVGRTRRPAGLIGLAVLVMASGCQPPSLDQVSADTVYSAVTASGVECTERFLASHPQRHEFEFDLVALAQPPVGASSVTHLLVLRAERDVVVDVHQQTMRSRCFPSAQVGYDLEDEASVERVFKHLRSRDPDHAVYLEVVGDELKVHMHQVPGPTEDVRGWPTDEASIRQRLEEMERNGAAVSDSEPPDR